MSSGWLNEKGPEGAWLKISGIPFNVARPPPATHYWDHQLGATLLKWATTERSWVIQLQPVSQRAWIVTERSRKKQQDEDLIYLSAMFMEKKMAKRIPIQPFVRVNLTMHHSWYPCQALHAKTKHKCQLVIVKHHKTTVQEYLHHIK